MDYTYKKKTGRYIHGETIL